jgi:hypothetical protein
MNGAFSPRLQQIQTRLEAIFGARMNVPDLDWRVRGIATAINVPAPRARRREAYLEWLHNNWEQTVPLLGQRVAGT